MEPSDTPDGASQTRTFLSLTGEIRLVIASQKQFVKHCNSALKTYKDKHLLTGDEYRRLINQHNSELGLPIRIVTSYSTFNHSHLIQRFQKDRFDISVFYVYFKNTEAQELQSGDDLLKNEFKNINDAFANMTSRMDAMIEQQGTSPSHPAINSSVIPSSLKFVKQTKDRYWRDFQLIIAAQRFVEKMIKDYETFLDVYYKRRLAETRSETEE